jgi:hypothetical protein
MARGRGICLSVYLCILLDFIKLFVGCAEIEETERKGREGATKLVGVRKLRSLDEITKFEVII